VRVQAEQIMQTQQMGMGGRRGLWIAKQATQQRNGVAQGGASFARLTIGPQERVQLAPLMHAPLDRQVEQQGLRFAQGKGEAVAVIDHSLVIDHGWREVAEIALAFIAQQLRKGQ